MTNLLLTLNPPEQTTKQPKQNINLLKQPALVNPEFFTIDFF